MMGGSGLKKREQSPKSQIERGVSLFCGEGIGAEQYIDKRQYMRGRGFLDVRVCCFHAGVGAKEFIARIKIMC